MNDELHPILRRQLKKCDISIQDVQDGSNLATFILKVNKAYYDFEQGLYLRERSLELSSKEMRELYAESEKNNEELQLLLNQMREKDVLLVEEKIKADEQADYIKNIFESIPDMLFILDTALNIVDVNGKVSTELALPKEKILANSIGAYLKDFSELSQLLQDQEHTGITYTTNFSGKNTLDVIVSASIFVYQLTDVIVKKNIICVVKDIVELKKLERENVEKMTMLSHAGRLTALGEMATAVAHELNQPLSVLSTNMQTIEIMLHEKYNADKVMESLPEIIKSSLQQVTRADKIISHMRQFARKDNPAELKKIDLRTPVEGALSMVREQFRLHNIKLEIEIGEGPYEVLASIQDIEQVLINFLTNARYAVEKRKEQIDTNIDMIIKIQLFESEKDKKIHLIVSDNGIGMSKEVLDHCLEPFFTTKPIGDGTGIGLSIVYNILKNVGGDLRVESKPNQGATFEIIFNTGESGG